MNKIWPWGYGAPERTSEHNALELQMSPDVQSEMDAYDLKPATQDSPGSQSQRTLATSRGSSLQQG